MTIPARHVPSRILRVFVLLMLVAGLLVRPLLVIACDIEDVRGAIAAGQEVVVNAETGNPAGDCCATTACGECCTPSTLGTPASTRLAAHVPASPQMLPEPPGRFEPTAYPVDSRPPIEA